MSKKKTHNEYVGELIRKNPNIEAAELYIDARTPILHHCKKHDVLWRISPSNALKGRGCPKCRSEKISHSLKKEHLEYVADLAIYNPSIDVVDEYINQQTPIRHFCKIHNYIWSAYPYNVLDGKGCPLCRSDKIKLQFTWGHEDYVAELAIKNPNIEVIEKYINMNTKIWHRCKIDGTEWQMTPGAILHSGCGCPQCNSKLKTHEQYISELFAINPNIEATEPYVDSGTPIWHHCLIDGHRWKASPSHTLRGTGCPKCQETKGEKSVRLWLEEHNFQYVYQKTFCDCRDKKVLPFDFYLPDYNILIEYDGQQHYEPVDFAGKGEEWALEQFKIIQRRDNIKNIYCQQNNIRLLRISYLQDVNQALDNFFI